MRYLYMMKMQKLVQTEVCTRRGGKGGGDVEDIREGLIGRRSFRVSADTGELSLSGSPREILELSGDEAKSSSAGTAAFETSKVIV